MCHNWCLQRFIYEYTCPKNVINISGANIWGNIYFILAGLTVASMLTYAHTFHHTLIHPLIQLKILWFRRVQQSPAQHRPPSIRRQSWRLFNPQLPPSLMFLSSPRKPIAQPIHQISGQESRSLNVIFAYAAPTFFSFCLSTMLPSRYRDFCGWVRWLMGKISHNEMTKQNARTAIFTLCERTWETQGGYREVQGCCCKYIPLHAVHDESGWPIFFIYFF